MRSAGGRPPIDGQVGGDRGRVGERPQRGAGSSAGNQRKPRARSSDGHRIVAHHHRPGEDGGLDGGQAETLPGRGVQHGIGGGVRRAPIALGERDPKDRDLRRLQQPAERRPVTLLGRARQPVGAAGRGGETERGRDVLALDGPDGMEQEGAVGVDAEPFRNAWPSPTPASTSTAL